MLEEWNLCDSETDKHWNDSRRTQSQVKLGNKWTHCEIWNNGVPTKHKRTSRQN